MVIRESLLSRHHERRSRLSNDPAISLSCRQVVNQQISQPAVRTWEASPFTARRRSLASLGPPVPFSLAGRVLTILRYQSESFRACTSRGHIDVDRVGTALSKGTQNKVISC